MVGSLFVEFRVSADGPDRPENGWPLHFDACYSARWTSTKVSRLRVLAIPKSVYRIGANADL